MKFWLEVNKFHRAVDSVQNLIENGSQNHQNDLLTFAKEIYSTFVADGAEMQINISEAQLMDIRQKIESEDIVKRDLFDAAQKEIYSLMSRNSYPRFLSSLSSRASSINAGIGKSSRRSTVLPT